MITKVINLGINGEGIIKVNDKVGFVDFALPNELIEADIIKENKKFYNLKLKKVIEKSEYRKEPICPYYYECGGCDLLHIDYSKSLDYKKDWVKNTFYKNAKVELNQINLVQSSIQQNYRNKGVFPVCVKENKITFGNFMKKSNNVMETKNCLLMEIQINDILEFCRESFNNLNVEFAYDFYKKTGFIKYLVVRSLNGISLITIVLNCNNGKEIPLTLKTFINKLQIELLRKYECGVYINYNINDFEILSYKFERLGGLDYLEDEFNGIKYTIDPYSFLQVNNEVRNKLYLNVLDSIDDKDIVIDGYSGAGLLTSILSKKAERVYGVEIVRPAVESADKLMAKNGITNVINVCGDSKIEIPKIIKCLNKKVTLVLDPPRSGVDAELIEKCKDKNIRKIIYISCNYSTCARDFALLKDEYEINSCTIYDMFPNTANIEIMLILNRRK